MIAQALFRPFTLGALSLPNRLVMAPMTRYFSPSGVPGLDVARYYARRAQAGVGLIMTEGTFIPHPSAHGFSNVPCFYGERALAGWREVLTQVHDAGGRIFPQLWHAGIARQKGMEPDPSIPGFAPSATPDGHKSMSDSEIADVIAAYAQAAGTAQAMGFDGVEIHGAHGYLIDAFLWAGTNGRTDRWGGDPLARTRFAVEVVRAVRSRVGPDFPISFRWSQFKQQDYLARIADTPQELERVLTAIADAGVTLFHASARRFWTPAFDGSDLSLAGWTRRLTGLPTIAVGSVGLAGISRIDGASDLPGGGYSFTGSAAGEISQLADLAERLLHGEFDLVAVGRSLLSDPEWAAKIREGRFADRIGFDKAHLAQLL
ncbi:MAG: NADH:flavin oxidoreductase [Sphingobium sp.]